ncbi:MAG: c-type cytochrome [Chloroflexota bacterium]
MSDRIPGPRFGSVARGRLLVLLVILIASVALSGCPAAQTPATASPAATKAATAAPAASPTAMMVASPSPVATKAATAAPTVAATAAPTKAATVPSPGAAASAVASAVAGAASTVGALAVPGALVYGRSCAGCHGDRGQGTQGRPAVLPPDAKLGARFATAKDLDTFVRTNMPRNAPGTLPAAEYDQVVSFILAGNNLAAATEQFTTARLEQIRLR